MAQIIKLDKHMPVKEKRNKPDNRPANDQSELDKKAEQILRRHRMVMKAVRKKAKTADIKALNYLYTSSLEMLPAAQLDYERNGKGLWAFNVLTNQVRELQNDLRALNTGGQTTEHLLNAIFIPTLQLVMQQVINEFSMLKQEITRDMPAKKADKIKEQIDRSLKNQGSFLNEISAKVTQQVQTFLGS